MSTTRFIAKAFIILNNLIFSVFLIGALIIGIGTAGSSYDYATGGFSLKALLASGGIALLVSLAGVVMCGAVALLGAILETLERIEADRSDEVYVPLGDGRTRRDPTIGRSE